MGTIAPRVTIRKAFRGDTIEALRKELSLAVADLQNQINAQGRILPHEDEGTRPRGLRKHDRLMGRGKRGTVTVVPDGKGGAASQEVPDSVTQFQDPQSNQGPPTTANFPTVGDFGWYRDTTGNKTYFVQNRAGNVEGVTPSALGINFTDISGTITDAQHGNRAGGALHAAVTSSVNGFMLATDKVILDAATNSPTASTLVLRGSGGGINALAYNVSGTQVVQARGTGYLNISTTSLKDGSAITTTFNATNFALLVRFTATVFDYLGVSGHGLIDL